MGRRCGRGPGGRPRTSTRSAPRAPGRRHGWSPISPTSATGGIGAGARAGPGSAPPRERIAGYRRASPPPGLPYDERPRRRTATPGPGPAAERATATRSPCAAPPTALVTANNAMTIGTLRALRDRGLSVPDDIALCCFDDFAWADLFTPRLTAIAQPSREIGAAGGPCAPGTPRRRRTGLPATRAPSPCTFVHRTSCGCPDSGESGAARGPHGPSPVSQSDLRTSQALAVRERNRLVIVVAGEA